jgi:hypothetical protein
MGMAAPIYHTADMVRALPVEPLVLSVAELFRPL